MDLNSLNTDVPIPALSIVFWVIAAGAFIALILPLVFGSKRFYLPGTPAIMAVVVIATMFAGLFTLGGAQVEAQDADFRARLSSDYGLLTESSAYGVRNAAREGRTVVMSDETNSFDVRPHLDGDRLTFYKVDRGELITPRK